MKNAEAANRVRERLLGVGICVPAHWALESCHLRRWISPSMERLSPWVLRSCQR